MLTKEKVESIFHEELALAKVIWPSPWRHPFTELRWTKAKTAFGYAGSNGHILISEHFLYTTHEEDLRDTIKHEIAHLIAGIAAGHDDGFFFVYHKLGGKRTTVGHAAPTQMKKKMQRQWQLFGYLEDGRKVKFAASHNRKSKYVGYKYNPERHHERYTHNGNTITHFEYKKRK